MQRLRLARNKLFPKNFKCYEWTYKKPLLLFCFVFIGGTFFACLDEDWRFPDSYKVVCNVPKFYDEKQGSYKGKVFLVRADYSLDTISTIEVKYGNYADKTIELKGFPIKCFIQQLDEELPCKIPYSMLDRQINLRYKYYLYAYLDEWEGDSIGPNYPYNLYTGINSEVYNDSIYNEDKTQKLKYSISAYDAVNDRDIITLNLECLELNGSIIEQPWYRREAKIELGKRIVTEGE